MRKAILGLSLFSYSVILVQMADATTTRDGAVNAAVPYTTVQVTLSTANLLSPATSQQSPSVKCDYRSPGLGFLLCEGTFVGEAYEWCGADVTGDYQGDVTDGLKVVADSKLGANCQGKIYDRQGVGYGVSNFTGLDCSGLVSNAWGLTDKKNTAGLRPLTVQVPWNKMKRGDIFLRDNDLGTNTHVAMLKNDLTTGFSADIIHAASKGFLRGVGRWRVVDEPGVPLSCPFDPAFCILGTSLVMEGRSPFPQFSDFTPADGDVIGSSHPAVSATIRSTTTIDTSASTLKLKIDGTEQTGLTISGSGGLVTISGTASSTLSDGNHTMTVTARTYDTASGLDLSDVSSGLGFTIGCEHFLDERLV